MTLTRPTILCLLFRRGPAAIARLVITVIVDSLNGVLWGGPSSHISKKFLKTVPSFANLDPAAAIILICGIIFIFATNTHHYPSGIFTRMVFAAGAFSVLEMVSAPETSTAFRVSAQKTAGKNCGSFPTITKTQPTRMTKAAIFYTPDDANFHEAPATKVSEMAHMWSIT